MMGTSASMPDTVDLATAKFIAGDRFEQETWDALATGEGDHAMMTREAFLALEPPSWYFALQSLGAAQFALVLAYLPCLFHYALCHTSQKLRSRVLASRPILYLYIYPQTISFSPSIPASEIVADTLLPGWSGAHEFPEQALDRLHVSLDSCPSGDCRRGAWRNEWLQKWRSGEESGLKKFTEEAYVPIVEDLVKQLFGGANREKYGETEVYYSTVPLLRCAPPIPPMSEDSPKGVTLPKGYTARHGVLTTRHTDGKYGHPTGEINFWMCVNSYARGTNSLYVDRTPWAGRKSSKPLEINYGEVGVFYGNQCPHETVRNETEVTRCSFDFRIIPGSFFEPGYDEKTPSYNWVNGYWTRMTID